MGLNIKKNCPNSIEAQSQRTLVIPSSRNNVASCSDSKTALATLKVHSQSPSQSPSSLTHMRVKSLLKNY